MPGCKLSWRALVMIDSRFRRMRETMLHGGVAARHARRAMLEIDAHFADLVALAIARGSTPQAAREDAHQVLGSDESLVNSFIAQPELQSWMSRHAGWLFCMAPFLSFVAFAVAAFSCVFFFGDSVTAYVRRTHTTPIATAAIDTSAQVLLLWIMPLCISGATAVLAYRQRIPLRWPVVGIVLLCTLAALTNVSVVLKGYEPGEIGAGFGVSTSQLPAQLARDVVTLTPAILPLIFLARRSRQRRDPD